MYYQKSANTSAETSSRPIVRVLLGQRRRRWPNIILPLIQCIEMCLIGLTTSENSVKNTPRFSLSGKNKNSFLSNNLLHEEINVQSRLINI